MPTILSQEAKILLAQYRQDLQLRKLLQAYRESPELTRLSSWRQLLGSAEEKAQEYAYQSGMRDGQESVLFWLGSE